MYVVLTCMHEIVKFTFENKFINKTKGSDYVIFLPSEY